MTKPWLPVNYSNERTLYLGICKAIERDVLQGKLTPGDSLPTHRELADTLGVAAGILALAAAAAGRAASNDAREQTLGAGAAREARAQLVEVLTCTTHSAHAPQ